MMKKLVIFLVLSLLTLTSVQAAITSIAIEEKTQKEIQLSEGQINRIAVSDGLVATVIANPTKFNIRVDEFLGQAFVTLFQPIEQPEGFTVITDSGYTQDFLVTTREGSPEIVYLEEPQEQEDFVSVMLGIGDFHKLYHGKEVEGFSKRLLRQNETIEVGELLPYVQVIEACDSTYETVYTIYLKNHSRQTLKIAEFDAPDINWFFCPVNELPKHQETKIVISKAKV